jgi:hypothetical protein
VNAIDFQSLHTRPCIVRLIRFPRAATGGNHLVSGGDETRNQKGADVPGRADYDDADLYRPDIAMTNAAARTRMSRSPLQT